MARRVPEVKPTSPAAAIVLVLLFIVCFIIGLWAVSYTHLTLPTTSRV